MKVTINKEIDVLYLIFNDNKIVKRIELELEISADIDINNKLVSLEILHYSKLRQQANDMLKENDLVVLQDSEIPFYMHGGYEMIYFRIEDIDKEDVICTCYFEADSMHRSTVKEFLQHNINFMLKHRELFPLKANNK